MFKNISQIESFPQVRVKIKKYTLLETNISPPKGTFESMIFLFPFGGTCDRSLEGIETTT